MNRWLGAICKRDESHSFIVWISIASNASFIPVTFLVPLLMRWPFIVPMGTSGSLYPFAAGKITFCKVASLFYMLFENKLAVLRTQFFSFSFFLGTYFAFLKAHHLIEYCSRVLIITLAEDVSLERGPYGHYLYDKLDLIASQLP